MRRYFLSSLEQPRRGRPHPTRLGTDETARGNRPRGRRTAEATLSPAPDARSSQLRPDRRPGGETGRWESASWSGTGTGGPNPQGEAGPQAPPDTSPRRPWWPERSTADPPDTHAGEILADQHAHEHLCAHVYACTLCLGHAVPAGEAACGQQALPRHPPGKGAPQGGAGAGREQGAWRGGLRGWALLSLGSGSLWAGTVCLEPRFSRWGPSALGTRWKWDHVPEPSPRQGLGASHGLCVLGR